jgi:hypothetical protein
MVECLKGLVERTWELARDLDRLLGLRLCCEPHTNADVKDAVLTVRLPSATRRRLETVARREGRSLSAQVERLVEQGLAAAATREKPRPLAGSLAGGRVPTIEDFTQVRTLLSASLGRRIRGRA